MKRRQVWLALFACLTTCIVLREVEARRTFYKTRDLTTATSRFFAGSGRCEACHGRDKRSMRDHDGNDVSTITDWRASMMANAANDPYWQAKVSHEAALYPTARAEIETTCGRCHAPMGVFQALFDGERHYTLAEIQKNPLARDGVSCVVCHALKADGGLAFDTTGAIFGPYSDPLAPPMINHTQFRPVYGAHLSESQLCGNCHTLLVNELDADGRPTGRVFPEQTVLQEWKNSSFARTNHTCQKCHLTDISKPVYLSSVPAAFKKKRGPYSRHTFLGGNVQMLRLLRQNIESLDLAATAEQFDRQIALTESFLRSQTLRISITPTVIDADTARFELSVRNLSGHKFPTGFPSRRAFISFTLYDEAGYVLFKSGAPDTRFEVTDKPYEPHHQIITSPQQAQIYELVLGDRLGAVTTALHAANRTLKDNRLPPQGFSMRHAAADTTPIVGNALNDPDFNRDGAGEGSGADRLYIHVPLRRPLNDWRAEAHVYFQTVPPRWAEALFDRNTPEIDRFRRMFAASDQSPVQVTGDTLTAPAIQPFDHSLRLSAHDRGWLLTSKHAIEEVSAFSSKGQLIYHIRPVGREVKLPACRLLVIRLKNGRLYRKEF